MKILMVCLGNICRSPLAEGILKDKVQQKGLNWEIDSAGTGSWHIGEQADPRSIAIAQVKGLDIQDHRARQFTQVDFDEFDYIFAMDESNLQNILRLARHEEDKAKVELIMNRVQPEANISVPDPYWNDDGFEQVYKMLDTACDRIVDTFEV